MSCTSESLDSLYWVELCRSSAYIWNESIIPLTNEMKPLKANYCVRSPAAAAAAQNFVWIHFICIYNFLIQMWSRNEIEIVCLGSRCSYLSWIIIQHSFWFGLVSLLSMPEHKRALIKTCLNTIYEIMQIWISIVYPFPHIFLILW